MQEIWEFHWKSSEVIPSEIESLLNINRSKNKAQVVRRSLSSTIFPGNDECTFVDFTTTVIPNAIAWIGKDCHGFSIIYHLLGSMPGLLNSKITSNMTVAMELPVKFAKLNERHPW